MNCHCGKKAIARGLCRGCYDYQRRYSELPPKVEKTCSECGAEFYAKGLCFSCYRASRYRDRHTDWRAENRERYNGSARKWRGKNSASLSMYIGERRKGIVHDIPAPVVEIAPFSRGPCGGEYDPVACPMRHRSGLIAECKTCKLFVK
jgi:hypothetical protein